MPRKRRVGRERKNVFLTWEQTLELMLGPRSSDPVTGRPVSVFASEPERKAAWQAYGDELRAFCAADVVPWAATFYAAGGMPAPDPDDG